MNSKFMKRKSNSTIANVRLSVHHQNHQTDKIQSFNLTTIHITIITLQYPRHHPQNYHYHTTIYTNIHNTIFATIGFRGM